MAHGHSRNYTTLTDATNFYLKPVDDVFINDSNIRYFRYVDDIRILTKSADDARDAALKLETVIRGLKLNLQSAKTKVVSAADGLRMIHDSRLDDLDQAQKLIRQGAEQPALSILDQVHAANGSCINAVSIKGSRPPLTDLNLRVFRRWAGLHLQVKSSKPIRRMCHEAQKNANFQVLRDIERVTLAFPSNLQVPRKMWGDVISGEFKFPMQQAELVRILRYFTVVPDAAMAWACERARDPKTMPYLRMQSVFLLSRSPELWPRGKDIERFPHVLTRWGFRLRLRCDSCFLLVAGGQHGWHERFHRIFGIGLLPRLMTA